MPVSDIWFGFHDGTKERKRQFKLITFFFEKNEHRVGETVACNLNKFCLICFKFKSIEPKNKFFSSLRRENEIKAHTREVSSILLSVACCVYCIAFLHLHYKNEYSKNPSNGRNKFDDFIVLLIETKIMIEKRHNDNGHYETMGDLDNHPKPSSHSAVSYFGRSLSLRVCVCV